MRKIKKVMSELPQINKEDLAVLSEAHKHLDNNKPEGNSRTLDPTNPEDKQLIQIILKTAGQTPEKYPYLHDQIENAEPLDPDNEPHKMTIIDAGSDLNGKATVLTRHANSQGTLLSGGSLIALDGEKNELLAYGKSTDVHNGLMHNHTNSNTSKVANKSIRVLGVNYMVNHNGQSQFTAIAGTRFASSAASTSLPVEPVTKHGTDFVLIAVGRDKNHINTDADYWYTETANPNDPNLIVPFQGHFTMPYEVATGITTSDIQTLPIIYADYTSKTKAQLVEIDSSLTTPAKIIAGLSIGTDKKTISWTFPYDGATHAITNSLVFNNGPVNDILSYFSFQFTVNVKGTIDPQFVFTVYSYSSSVQAAKQPFTPSQQGVQILPIQFTWHCLAKGTQVTLANGNLINVEDLNNTHRVQSGSDGGSLGVEATILGHHDADLGQTGLEGVYRLHTNGGKELVATGAHPIMTPNGAIMICHLNPGDKVVVKGGINTVTSCEPIKHSGMFYDVKLGNSEDRAKAPLHRVNSLFANGILVGDHMAMNNQADRQRYDLDYILPRIDSQFHTDYTNSVNDRFN